MEKRILFIISTFNIFGGTPKKTLDLMSYFGRNSSIYAYESGYDEYARLFENTGGKVFRGYYGHNLISHLRLLLKIIDTEKITVVQTQFTFGEILGVLLKILRPKLKINVAFVSPFSPKGLKYFISKLIYPFIDSFTYISHYVECEKKKQFSMLKRKNGCVIYNGSELRKDNGSDCVEMKPFALLDIAGLLEWKNIQVLVKMIHILNHELGMTNVNLYVAGDGCYRNELEKLINQLNVNENVFLIGYQNNVGRLLNQCDIFVHAAYAEGFGIVVPEAMLANKPIIVSNAGALPELIDDKITGLIATHDDPYVWANYVQLLIQNPQYAQELANNANVKAATEYSAEKFAKDYDSLFSRLLETK